jgi:hypothetical protein
MIKTISMQGYKFKVNFDYEPAEAQTHDYPGCQEAVVINEVWDFEGDRLKDWAFNLIENDMEYKLLWAVHADMEAAKLEVEDERA